MRARQLAGVVAATAVVALVAGSQAIALAPSATLDVAFAPGLPAPPVLNQDYGYAIGVGNDGDVALDNMVIVDTVPVELRLSSVTTGSYTGLSEFAAGEGVRVSYEKNTALGVFTLWGSSPNVTTNTNLTAPPPGLGAGEYITRVRWEFGQAAPGMGATVRPVVAGRVINPDNSGGPVAVGDTIQNCATLTAVHTAGPTNVSRNACRTFQLIAGPAVTIAAPDSTPRGSAMRATATLSGGDPTGTLAFRVFAAGDAACGDPLFDGAVSVDGAGPYVGPEFVASAAGAFKWVAFYGGDVLHAPGQSGCSDPAGAFAVVAPPALSASFAPATIAVGETTALSFTVANPAANTVPLTGVELENALPDGLAVASPNGLSGSCGAGTITAAPGSQSVTLAGGTIAVGSQCSFSVDVTASEHGEVTNTSAAVQSANGGSGNAASASLTVIAEPVVTIAAPDSTPLGSTTRAAATLSGGDPTGTLTFGVFAAGDAACDDALLEGVVSVDGVGPYEGPEFGASDAGAYKWVARYGGDVFHAPAENGCSDPAGAFAVVAPPVLSASFAPATIAVGETTALSFTIANPAANTVPLTGVALQNALPDGLAVASPNGLSGDCGAGTITAAPGSQSVTLAGGMIAVGSECSFSVDVTASERGDVENTSEAVQSANGGSGNAATASLTVTAPPVIPPEPEPEPKPPPAGAAPPVPDVPAAVMRLRVPRLSVFGRSAAARCRMRAGEINYCAVRLRARGRLVARGRAENLDEPGQSLDVALRLTRRGRALLARRLGGVRARVRAVAATSDGDRRARARTRAILKVERFTTPPGSWEPDEVAFTRRGESFLRGLRARLVAVSGLRCNGHSANVWGTTVATSPLSRARAAFMCEALRKLGIRARTRLGDRGDSKPIAPNENESGRAANRRVVVTVTHRARRLRAG